MRIFEHRRLWHMAADQYWAATRLLAAEAAERLGEVRTVVGIAEGGRAPAYAIGAETGASVHIVKARHNASDEIGLPATGKVTYDLGAVPNPLRGPVLVVDDICGSGSTLIAVVSALQPLTVPDAMICTATLCRNAGAPPGLPDLYMWEVADWVVFPWERVPPGRQASPLPAHPGMSLW
ncbi:phosphoribosyltransferase [Spongiactinospora sp. TRM90649]|uniref:phosphoribosyltransferase n=1 Tax=Spongiactinospora sp. TRM90649 TaxID=3031114 RepID=UPI0023F69335|nr:phosphoribosyltransferase [Spongiactinospora sp. TRM90649]MDF5759037.1 phosphoribosyltransferase [Spongiactinospora sp. TRM90649]